MTPTPSPAVAASRPRRASPPLLDSAALCALVATLAAGPASAQVTAQSAREEFETFYETAGMTVEAGSEEAADGTITLGDVTMAFEFTDEPSEDPFAEEEGLEPEAAEEVRVEAVFERIAFEERPDGTVLVTLPAQSPLTVRSTDVETGEEDLVRLDLLSEGFEMVLSEVEAAAGEDGVEPARRYAYTADRLGLRLVEASVAGEPVEGSAEIVASDVTGTTLAEPGAGPDGEATRYVQSVAMAGIAGSLDLAPPPPDEGEEEAGPGRLVASYDQGEVSFTGGATLPPEEVMAGLEEDDDGEALFDAGFGFSVDLSYGPGTASFTATDAGDEVTVEVAGRGGETALTFDADAMTASGRSEGTRYTVRSDGGAMPLPLVELTIGEAEGAFEFPVSASDRARPFELRYLLSDLTLNEEVWALLDPEGVLPRDPATLLLAVEGRLRLLASLIDEEAQAAADEAGEIPAEVERAGLELRLGAVGATVDATGDFTFDNDDTTTFPGSPAPTGTLSVEATGIDALLDTLTDMGLVPPDQLMPARMMLGLFARPDGEGGYTSVIEVDGDTGAVTANGQRLR